MPRTKRPRLRPNVERTTTRNTKVRWDIQGLRAFAVLAVVADHLFDYPRGGFVGVDVFFVISGFLISSHLIRQAEGDGIKWVDFYRKRIKRIIPAAVLVLVVTTIASHVALSPARADSVRADSVWALLFGANFRMLDLNTDYFNATGTSPVQHYWSLSIEEQFYFVWPILLLALYFVLRRTAPHHLRLAAGVTMGVVVAASFTWAIVETNSNPSAAYFNTAARFWELGVGALLAVSVPLLHRIPDVARVPMAWLGLGGATASLWVVDETQGFPAPWAALPVVCTALVIAAGTYRGRERQQVYLLPLTNRACNYVGDISYSLYLWHFPIIIIGTATWGDSASVKVGLLVSMFVIAIYSFELVENPLRRLDYSKLSRRRGSFSEQGQATRWKYTALSFGVIITSLLVVVSLRPVEPPRAVALPPGAFDQLTTAGAPTELAALQEDIVEALEATSWPDLNPSIDQVATGPQADPVIVDCGLPPDNSDSECTFGDPAGNRMIVTVGDSTSLALTGVLRAGLGNGSGWKVRSLGTFGCPFAIGSFDYSAQVIDSCDDRQKRAVTAINQTMPDLVFVTQTRPRAKGGGDIDRQAWSESVRRRLEQLRIPANRLVFVGAPPRQEQMFDCYTRRSTPADCAGEISSGSVQDSLDTSELAKKMGARFVNSTPWTCVFDHCPAFVGTAPTMMDAIHYSPAYAKRLGPVVVADLRAQGVLSSD